MLTFPEVIMGTSSLGNLYQELSGQTKLEIVKAFIEHSVQPAAFDTAGKYGAGLALESLGHALQQLNIAPEDVIISNKLGWLRVPLAGEEPTFEKGVWKNIRHDAVQRIGYEGIMACYEQGNELLGAYKASCVSVHDPDEYLAGGKDHLYADILEAYQALHDLKKQGKVQSVGVGAKDWRMIQRLSADVELDWVMFANSYTLYDHPTELAFFMHELHEKGVCVINSAVFNGGFLTGGDFYNYKPVDRNSEDGQKLYAWRERFFMLCEKYHITPAAACVQFGLKAPGVSSIALNTSRPAQVGKNLEMVRADIPAVFWNELVLL